VSVSARTPQGETKTATAYQSNPSDSANYGLRFFTHIAHATLTFEPLTPPPGEAVVEAAVVRLGPEGQRFATDGLIVEGSRLVVGIRRKNAVVEGVSIGDQAYTVVPDTLPRTDPMGFDLVTSEEFVASPPGTYRVEVQAKNEHGIAMSATRSFRVLARGGQELTDPDSRPSSWRTGPARRDAANAAVTSLIQVQFTEPVRNVPGSVRLLETTGGQEQEVGRASSLPPGAQAAVDVTPASQAGQPVVALSSRPCPA
jgi:hypothetical protein